MTAFRTRAARALVAVPLTAGLLSFGPGAAFAHADDDVNHGPNNNLALALNGTDDSVSYDSALSVRLVTDGQVTQTNRAIALASCVNCRTVALAFQVVLVDGSPSVLTPVNQATAVNQLCAQCVTYAGAKQLVIGVNGPVQLTDPGQARLNAVRKSLKAFQGQVATVTLAQLLTFVNDTQAELQDIYTTELVAATDGHHVHADVVASDAA